MKRLGLFLSIILIMVMGIMPLYALSESLRSGKLPALTDRVHWNTNNTTRLGAENWQDLQQSVVHILYPAGQQAPDFVILSDQDSWPQSLAATCLLSAPARAALLMIDPGQEEQVLQKIQDIVPRGSQLLQGVDVVLLGDACRLEDVIRRQGFRVIALPGDDADVTAGIVQIRRQFDPEVNEFIIVDAQADAGFALPAAAWSSHRGTPILLLSDGQLQPGISDLMNPGREAAFYLLLPSDTNSSAFTKQLADYGMVERIDGTGPVAAAVEFARFFDGDRQFGWNSVQSDINSSKKLLLVPLENWRYGIIGAQLFSQSIFGPLLLTETEQVPAVLEKFYFGIKPDWWVTPAEGPYNHTWIMGDTSEISYPVQGRINFLQEIGNYQTQGNQALSGIEALALIWYILAVAGAIWTWLHLSSRMFQLPPFMKLAWVLLVLALGPAGLLAYYLCYRGYGHQVAYGEFPRPLWVQTLAATCSTAGFGIPAMITIAFFLTYLGLPLFFNRSDWFVLGAPMFQSVLWSYLGTLVVNALVFVPLMMAFREDSTYWDTVKSNWLTVFISMTSISLGMMTAMWLLMMGYLDMMPEESNLNWWGSMYAANLVGLTTGYLGNRILVVRGEKKASM